MSGFFENRLRTGIWSAMIMILPMMSAQMTVDRRGVHGNPTCVNICPKVRRIMLKAIKK